MPFTVMADGRVWVLLSHRSPHVQAGDSWSCFGGAMDEGETPWQAAIRETAEEIRGIPADPAAILGEHIWQCPERCGWSYRTYVVRVPPHSGGHLPRVRVTTGAHAWETSELAWIPTGQVTVGRQLHPAFADAWPALREQIEASVRGAGITTGQVNREGRSGDRGSANVGQYAAACMDGRGAGSGDGEADSPGRADGNQASAAARQEGRR